MQYKGLLKIDANSVAVLHFAPNATSTQFGDLDWFITPTFETSDPELKWTESSTLLAEGRWIVDGGKTGVEYVVWKVEPGK